MRDHRAPPAGDAGDNRDPFADGQGFDADVTARARSLAAGGGGGTGRATIHPSYLLRLPDKSRADEEYAMVVADLKGWRGSGSVTAVMWKQDVV